MKIAAILIDTCRELLYRKTLIIFFGMVTLTHLFFILALQTDVADGAIASMRLFGMEGNASGGDLSFGSGRSLPAGELSAGSFVRGAQMGVVFFLYPLGILLSLFATASLVPRMIHQGAIDLLLSKPMSRTRIFLARYLGALLVGGGNLLYLVAGLGIILWAKTGYWNGGLILSGLVMTLYFAALLGFLVLIGTISRSTTVSIMVTALMFFVGLVVRFPHQNSEWPLLITGHAWRFVSVAVVEVLYHALPRTYDFGEIAGTLILQRGPITWGPILNTVLTGAVALAAATVYFKRTDF